MPSKLSNSKNKKQARISHQIKHLSRKKQRLYNTAKSLQSLNLWQAYYKVKKERHKTYHTAYNNYVASLVEEERTTKKSWSFIQSQRKDNCGVPPLKHNSNIYTDHLQKAEILNSYFSSVFTNGLSACLPT